MSRPSTSCVPVPLRTVASADRSVPIAIAFCLASFASVFAMAWSLTTWLIERSRG